MSLELLASISEYFDCAVSLHSSHPGWTASAMQFGTCKNLAECHADTPGEAVQLLQSKLLVRRHELLSELKELATTCQCTASERLSGHLVDCHVPRAQQIVEDL